MRTILIGLALTLAALPAAAQTREQNWAKCKGVDPDLNVSGCTALIQSGRETAADLAVAYRNRGSGYGALALLDESIADETKAIALRPDYAEAYQSRGSAYADKGLADQAIADYTKAIALKPDFADAYSDRGGVYEEKGQRDQAIADYRAALKLDPTDDGSKDALKRLHATP
ncbi:MAG: tetratricopeptide repeat protein [Roseiarcus sp.]|jgi:tetratricopeptide (TPR) repeat protein